MHAAQSDDVIDVRVRDRDGRDLQMMPLNRFQDSAGIVAYPAFKHPAINCSGLAWVDEMAALLETVPEFSDEYDKIASIAKVAREDETEAPRSADAESPGPSEPEAPPHGPAES